METLHKAPVTPTAGRLTDIIKKRFGNLTLGELALALQANPAANPANNLQLRDGRVLGVTAPCCSGA